MPYPNEHAARMVNPDNFESFIRNHPNAWPEGLDIIFGVRKDGSRSVQAFRFRTDQWTVERARRWLARNGYDPILFEPATG